jgi:hypothetical protein
LQERRRFRARVCPISPEVFLQFTQGFSVNFANGEKRDIFLLLSRALCSKTTNWSCEIPARKRDGPSPEPSGESHKSLIRSEKISGKKKQSEKWRKYRTEHVSKYLTRRRSVG